jgi:hypothetical protein
VTKNKATVLDSPQDTIIGAANELNQVCWELNELSNTFFRLGMHQLADELRGHSKTAEGLAILIRRAATQTQNR